MPCVFTIAIIYYYNCSNHPLALWKVLVSYLCNPGTLHTLLSLSFVNRYVLYVNIFLFDIASLCYDWCVIPWMRWNMCCMLYSGMLVFLSHLIDFCGLIVSMWIKFCLALDIITFVIFRIHNLSINCHTYLNLVRRDFFFGL